jgi:signal transduction histidine kinase
MGVFLSVFVGVREISILRISTMIFLGICYVFIGIYIYSLSAGNSLVWLRFLYIIVELALAISIIFISKGIGISILILLPVIGHSVVMFSPRVMLGINGLIAIVYFTGSRFFSTNWESAINGLPIFLAGQIFIIIFMQMTLEEEKAHTKIKQLITELESANKNLQNYANQIEDLTLARERNRFAREIHDGLGHYLTVIHMQIQAAKAIMNKDPIKAKQTLETAQKQAQEALIDVRKSVSALRDAHDGRITLVERVQQLVSATTSDSLDISTEVKGMEIKGLPHLELTVFRIIQEGIQNCIKHSGATQLKIFLDYSEGGVLFIAIQDNGLGTDSIVEGFGLRGMDERIKQLGGKFNYRTQENEGFIIEVEVPL